jgi:hypothetical protein
VDDLLVQATVLVVDADNTATKESKSIDSFNRQITSTLGNVNKSVLELTKSEHDLTLHSVQSLDAVTSEVKGLQAVTDASTSLLASAKGTVDGLNRVVSDPAISQTLANVQEATKESVPLLKQSTATMNNLSGTTKDVQEAVHGYLHPTWPQRVLGWLETGAKVAISVF